MTANIERLQQLRRVIEAAPEDRLHMRTFCEEAECGTAYCAAGWAAIDPWFQENTDILRCFSVDEDGVVSPGQDGHDPFYGLAKTFGLLNRDAERLFGSGMSTMDDPPHAVAKAEVLANIDRLLAGQPAERYRVIEERRKRNFPYAYS